MSNQQNPFLVVLTQNLVELVVSVDSKQHTKLLEQKLYGLATQFSVENVFQQPKHKLCIVFLAVEL